MLKPRVKNVTQQLATGFAAVLLGSTVSNRHSHYCVGRRIGSDGRNRRHDIRGSMQQSLERKRNADHFVNAITAEDIGHFRIRIWLKPCSGSAASPSTARAVRALLSAFAGSGPSSWQRRSAGVFPRPTSRLEATMAGVTRTLNPAPSAFTPSSPGWCRRWKSTSRHGLITSRAARWLRRHPAAQTLRPRKAARALSLETTRNELSNDTAPGYSHCTAMC